MKRESVFVKESYFKDFSKGKSVKNFGNPYVKEVDGRKVNIIPNGECVTFKKMDEEDVLWFLGKKEGEFYMAGVKVGGWFPTELVCGVVKGFFSEDTELARETGFVWGNSCLGSANVAFEASKAKVAASKLEAVGFEVVFE